MTRRGDAGHLASIRRGAVLTPAAIPVLSYARDRLERNPLAYGLTYDQLVLDPGLDRESSRVTTRAGLAHAARSVARTLEAVLRGALCELRRPNALPMSSPSTHVPRLPRSAPFPRPHPTLALTRCLTRRFMLARAVHRRELVSAAARTLKDSQMAVFDDRSGALYVTELGRVASHYYIKAQTMVTFNGLLK